MNKLEDKNILLHLVSQKNNFEIQFCLYVSFPYLRFYTWYKIKYIDLEVFSFFYEKIPSTVRACNLYNSANFLVHR